MQNILTRGVFLPVALALLAGCTTPYATLPPGSTAYRTGFAEGCDAGYAVAGSPFYAKLEEARPQRSDEDYIGGWARGFHRCKSNYERVQSTIASFLGPPL